MAKLPKKLQPVLWSVKNEDLDLEKDKVYIIHQILSFGNLQEWKWLFNHYSLKEIKEVFLKYPIRIYRPQAFNFIKEILLKIKDKKLDKEKYVITPITKVSFVKEKYSPQAIKEFLKLKVKEFKKENLS